MPESLAGRVYEESWQRECDEIGFFEPPPDSGYGTRDYLYMVWPGTDPPRSALFAAPGP